VKGEAAALSVCAQHCQSHYFSTTPPKMSVTVAMYNDWLQNTQAVFNFTKHARVYD